MQGGIRGTPDSRGAWEVELHDQGQVLQMRQWRDEDGGLNHGRYLFADRVVARAGGLLAYQGAAATLGHYWTTRSACCCDTECRHPLLVPQLQQSNDSR